MINPDGVYRGHYRTDTLGQNLNRFYLNPTQADQPQIYAINQLVLSLHQSSRLYGYIDLHAHAGKKGCFIYGNSVDFRNQIEICMFCKLLQMNSPYFEYNQSNFTEKNMYSKDKADGLSKEGSGRVAIYKQTKINLCFTLECNYNMGSITNMVAQRAQSALQGQMEEASGKPPGTAKEAAQINKDIVLMDADTQSLSYSQPYVPAHYENIGEVPAFSLFHMHKCPPSAGPRLVFAAPGARPSRLALEAGRGACGWPQLVHPF